jgi:DNA (cytosine-5)-methyltransferase 1
MNELALFAGAGGGILGGKLLGWRTICAVEIDPYCRRVLLARQRDGCLPRFPIWDDVTTFDGNPWRGRVDVVSGGFPCQDISAAGKGAGLSGERSGLWADFARIIGEVQPRFVLVENSPMLTLRGLGVVLGDLAALGYDARWGVISATDVGAPHLRERIWIVAHAVQDKQLYRRVFIGDNGTKREWTRQAERCQNWNGFEMGQAYNPVSLGNEADKSNSAGMANGVAYWMERVAAIGNGQVPAVVRLAWETLIAQPYMPGLEP